jgi:hypothetical protein
MFSFQRYILLVALVWVVQTASVRSADTPQLDCAFRDGSGIFAPGQTIVLDVTLRPPTPNVGQMDLHTSLTDVSQSERFPLAGLHIKITPNAPVPISFVTPEKEGVYEVFLTVTVQEVHAQRPLLMVPRKPDRPVIVARTVAEVRKQFVVLSPQVVPRAVGDWIRLDTRNLLEVADGPTRRFQLPLPKMGDLPKITDLPRPATLLKQLPPLGRRNSTQESSHNLWDVPGGPHWYHPYRLRLPVPQRQFLEKSEQNPNFSALPVAGTLTDAWIDKYTWYSLPMEVEVGKPYLIEIDYPTNIPQTFGVAVVRGLSFEDTFNSYWGYPDTATNIHVVEEIIQDISTEAVATHQLFFWAETESSELVLINRQPNQEALFRNIRVSQITMPGQPNDQRFPKLFEGKAQRKRIGQITVGRDPMRLGTRFVSWQNTYEECSHLIDRLHRGGYDGVTFTVPTPSSTFSLAKEWLESEDGKEDRERLARLEMVFQRFDREGLTLIPAIEFDFLYTEETVITPLHNVLQPAVQQAMGKIVIDLVNRLGHHSSFGGVAIVLSPETFAQLPFPPPPPDDYAFAQFRRETERELGTLPDEKLEYRLNVLQSNPRIWEAWVRWQAAKVSGFYAHLAQQVSMRRADAPLYLFGGAMLDQPEIQDFCAPTLPRNFRSLQAMQLLGFDLPTLSQAESLHFLRPVRISETRNHAYDGLNSIDTTSFFFKSDMLPGVQFIHADTDGFVTTPTGIQSRKRFVRQLAQADVLMFMDGGVSLPFGQESALFDLLDTYRRLPPVSFRTFQPSINAPSIQPLTVRYHNSPEEMIVYFVNDAPFAVEADFAFSAGTNSNMTELTGHRMIRSINRNPQRSGSYTWRASLLPYDLLAIRISDANAKIESVSVQCPPSIVGAEGVLKQKVEKLERQVHAARNGVIWDGLFNGGFEMSRGYVIALHLPGVFSNNAEDHTRYEYPGWQCLGGSLTAQPDQTAVYQGQNSVKLTNSSVESGTFLSDPLTLPATGRLGVSICVGISADCKALPMNVVLTAKYRRQPYYRSVSVEATLMPLLANVEPKNDVRWHPIMVPFERLPKELEEVRIGVTYSGIGTVWLDDITLYPVLFSRNEMFELQQMLVVADYRCSSGRVSELISLLESHWSQFLFQHVPAPTPQPAISTPKPPIATEVPPPKKSPTMYQRVRGLFGG